MTDSTTHDDHPVAHVQCPATHELRGRCQFIGYPNELTYHAEGRSHVDRLGVHWDEPSIDAHLAHARYLGADAALAAAASLTMSESDAMDFLDGDGDQEIRERYLSDGEPNLSGEWVDDLSYNSLILEVTGATELREVTYDAQDAIATAWEEGRDAVWSDAVTAFACRITGDIPRALSVEASNESYVDTLRAAPERSFMVDDRES